MNAFQQIVSTMTAPGLLIIVALVVMGSAFRKGWIGQFITALNSMNTPWVAIIVIVLGMIFDLKCKQYGLTADSANQIIGGGLGLLTGQALKNNGNTSPVVMPALVQAVPPQPSTSPVEPENRKIGE